MLKCRKAPLSAPRPHASGTGRAHKSCCGGAALLSAARTRCNKIATLRPLILLTGSKLASNFDRERKRRKALSEMGRAIEAREGPHKQPAPPKTNRKIL